MMINGKQDTVVRFAGSADIDRRFAAITADLQTWARPTGLKRNFIEATTFVFVEKTFGR
jgi:hypothetical protein